MASRPDLKVCETPALQQQFIDSYLDRLTMRVASSALFARYPPAQRVPAPSEYSTEVITIQHMATMPISLPVLYTKPPPKSEILDEQTTPCLVSHYQPPSSVTSSAKHYSNLENGSRYGTIKAKGIGSLHGKLVRAIFKPSKKSWEQVSTVRATVPPLSWLSRSAQKQAKRAA